MRSPWAAALILCLVGCGAPAKPKALPAAAANACGEGPGRLRARLASLPLLFESDGLDVELPESTLGMAPTGGSVLSLGASGMFLDGKELGRVSELRALSSSATPVLYIAAPASRTVRELREVAAAVPDGVSLRALVRTRLDKTLPATDSATPAWAREQALRLLSARSSRVRAELAREGYRRATYGCAAVDELNVKLGALPPRERFRGLARDLAKAVEQCDCRAVDLGALNALLVADHRSGTATLGSLPISFLRDHRCGASMPVRPLGKLVLQMERFDIEFSGQARGDELFFDDVLTNERLLVEFCDALAGETLAGLQRLGSTLYWPVQKGAGVECQAWRFHPVAPGVPTGTWNEVQEGGSPASVRVLDYVEAAEELRLSVPVAQGDEAPSTCKAVYRLVGVDKDSISLSKGRWFFTAEACKRADPSAVPTGSCIDAWLAGASPATALPSEGATVSPPERRKP